MPSAGRDGGIRTHDLSVPNRALYQAEPHPDEVVSYTVSAWRGKQSFGDCRLSLARAPRRSGRGAANGKRPGSLMGPGLLDQSMVSTRDYGVVVTFSLSWQVLQNFVSMWQVKHSLTGAAR
jgi:hypothetical protein